MITLIIGKQSNLSQHIYAKLDDVILLSSREIMFNINVLDEYKDKKFNIIFNNFQPANLLNDITSLILNYIQYWNINKIIYTSSNPVYENNILCKETKKIKSTKSYMLVEK